MALGVSQGPGASGKESALAVSLEVPESPFALLCAVRGDGGGARSQEEDGLPGDRKPLRKCEIVEGDSKRPEVWESRAWSHQDSREERTWLFSGCQYGWSVAQVSRNHCDSAEAFLL